MNTVKEKQNESIINDILHLMADPSSPNSSNNFTIGEGFRSADGSERDSRYEKLLEQNNIFVNEIKKLWIFTTKLKHSVKILKSEKDKLEQELNNLNAYSRRNNIEIRNIPEIVKDDALEDHCLKVFKLLNLDVTSYDIVAVHRTGKFSRGRNRPVIIRFVNRKHAYHALDNANHLFYTIYKKYFITENLCPTYRNTFNILYKGKKKGTISDVWSYNGIVYAKMTNDGEKLIVATPKSAQLFLDTAESMEAVREVSSANRSNLSSPSIIESTTNTNTPTPNNNMAAETKNDPITPVESVTSGTPDLSVASAVSVTNVTENSDDAAATDPPNRVVDSDQHQLILCQPLEHASQSNQETTGTTDNDVFVDNSIEKLDHSA